MNVELADSTVVTRCDGWLSAWVGEEHVMMSAETGTCISLSETGGRIWELLEEPQSISVLCATLAEEYEVEPSVLRSDLMSFVQLLEQQHALSVQ